MKLQGKYLDKITNRLLQSQQQGKALKQLAQKRDWKSLVQKCHDRLTLEYRFWVNKGSSSVREAKLQDLNRDIAFIKTIQDRDQITPIESARLKDIVSKYDLNNAG